MSLKVLDRFGNGNKDILAAFRWIENHREEYKIRIVNISVGTTYKTRSDKDVLVRGVEALWIRDWWWLRRREIVVRSPAALPRRDAVRR